MDLTLDRARLRARYKFTGMLVLDTALHIGGGRDSSTVTDNPIIRDAVGRPFVPGSSFKGAFRAAIERLVPNVSGWRTCQLITIPEERVAESSIKCLSVRKDLADHFSRVTEAAGRGVRFGEKHQVSLHAFGRPEWMGQTPDDSYVLDLLAEFLCDTCKTFGSLQLASVVHFHDLPVVEPWDQTTQIRDGVGIDRDSERAKDQIKFDYEVVPPQTVFAFSMTLESPTNRDLSLIALGLHEFQEGMVPLGGIRTRGLGRCHLEQIGLSMVDFTQPMQMMDYFKKGWPKPGPIGDFLANHIPALLPA